MLIIKTYSILFYFPLFVHTRTLCPELPFLLAFFICYAHKLSLRLSRSPPFFFSLLPFLSLYFIFVFSTSLFLPNPSFLFYLPHPPLSLSTLTQHPTHCLVSTFFLGDPFLIFLPIYVSMSHMPFHTIYILFCLIFPSIYSLSIHSPI